MPRVPRIDQTAIQSVSSRPIDPGYRSGRGADADAFGSNVGRAVSGLGAAVQGAASTGANILRDMQRIENEHIAREKQVAFRAGLQNLWNGTEKAPGFGQLQGNDAVNAANKHQEEVRKLKAKLLNDAPHVIKPRLTQTFDALELEELDSAHRHVERERRVAAKNASEAKLGLSIEYAVRQYDDPRAIRAEEIRGTADIEEFLSDQGVAPEVLAARKLEFTSALHSAVIDRHLADDNVEMASRYFNVTKDRIDSGLHARIVRNINNAKEDISQELLAKARANEQFVATFGRLPGSYASDQGQLDALGGERGKKAAQAHRQLGQMLARVNEYQALPIAEQARILQERYSQASDADDVPLFQALAQSHSVTQKALRDGTILDLYRDRGQVELEPLSDGQPGSMQRREAVAARLSEQLGVPVAPLTKDEAQALAERIENAPSEQVGALFSNLTEGFSEEALGSVAQQLSLKRPNVLPMQQPSSSPTTTPPLPLTSSRATG
jgi:hypothetical protein